MRNRSRRRNAGCGHPADVLGEKRGKCDQCLFDAALARLWQEKPRQVLTEEMVVEKVEEIVAEAEADFSEKERCLIGLKAVEYPYVHFPSIDPHLQVLAAATWSRFKDSSAVHDELQEMLCGLLGTQGWDFSPYLPLSMALFCVVDAWRQIDPNLRTWWTVFTQDEFMLRARYIDHMLSVMALSAKTQRDTLIISSARDAYLETMEWYEGRGTNKVKRTLTQNVADVIQRSYIGAIGVVPALMAGLVTNVRKGLI